MAVLTVAFAGAVGVQPWLSVDPPTLWLICPTLAIALAAMMLGGGRLWLPVLVAATLAHVAVGGAFSASPWWLIVVDSLLRATGIAGGAVLALQFLSGRQTEDACLFPDVPRFARFVLAAVVTGPACAAVGIVLGRTLTDTSPGTLPGFINSWFALGVGVLTLTPAILAIGHRLWKPVRWFESIAYLLSLVLIVVWCLGLLPSSHGFRPSMFLVAPWLVWGVLRLSPCVAGGSLAGLALAVAATTASQRGPYAATDPWRTSSEVQLLLLVIPLTLYVVGCVTTQRKRAEQSANTSERRFRRLLASVPDAMLIVDRQGSILLVNRRVERLFGYAAEELLGMEVNSLVAPKCRDQHVFRTPDDSSDSHGGVKQPRPELWMVTKEGREFSAELSLGLIETAEGQMVSATIRDITERLRAEEELHDSKLQLLAAQKIQQKLLPPFPPRLPGFDIHGALYAADFAAGDQFDYLALPDQSLGVIVGDVSGHGFSSALLMASTQTLLRLLVENRTDLGEVLTRANRFLARETTDDRFITLFAARIDLQNLTLSYVNAGHPAGCLLDSSGNVKLYMTSTNVPLSVDSNIEYRMSPPQQLQPGDTILLLTDGLLETKSPLREEFGMTRTIEVVRGCLHQTAQQIVEQLCEAAHRFSGHSNLADDMTIVLIKVLPH